MSTGTYRYLEYHPRQRGYTLKEDPSIGYITDPEAPIEPGCRAVIRFGESEPWLLLCTCEKVTAKTVTVRFGKGRPERYRRGLHPMERIIASQQLVL